MKRPAKATAESERSELVEFERKFFCDSVIVRAVALMEEAGAPPELICERMLTHMTCQAALITGRERLVEAFRMHLRDIESGVFHRPPDAPEISN